ncbi:MAG TPA: ATP synthase F0 subunit B [Terriglobia bacterium]|nr:ATP synthase F0 subunit B [Terriglobia bacterium]
MSCFKERLLGALVLSCCLVWVATPSKPFQAASFSLAEAAGLAGGPEEAGEGKKEEHELLFKIVNFALLAGGLFFLLRKPAAEYFAQRSAAIKKSLEEGRKALEDSQAQLAAVEEKLKNLEQEIAAFKASAEREMEAERQRLRQAAAEEAEKILESARLQMETSSRAAILELKAHLAQQVLALAEEMIRKRLDEAGRERLVRQFIARVNSP